jgi:hypothetical protein
MKVIRVPPRYSQFPLFAVIEASEKQVNIAAVEMRAVTIILGLTAIAKSSNEPNPRPVIEMKEIG